MPIDDLSTKLLCVRHGESEGNRDRCFCATPEVPLTALGREQALAAARALQEQFRPARLISSPYRRAWETAQVIAHELGLRVEVEHDLRERSIGIYAGQPYDVVLEDPTFREHDPWAWRPLGGESLLDVAARAVPAAQRIAEQNLGSEVVLVSHAGVIAALCAAACGGWQRVPAARNGQIIVLEYRQGRLSLLSS
ncbi:MAG: histidine phosphatase family protein [Candidatus Binatia bacterium]|nr:histidine phosphatase family protein [Candidatus Binatia bacterium]